MRGVGHSHSLSLARPKTRGLPSSPAGFLGNHVHTPRPEEAPPHPPRQAHQGGHAPPLGGESARKPWVGRKGAWLLFVLGGITSSLIQRPHLGHLFLLVLTHPPHTRTHATGNKGPRVVLLPPNQNQQQAWYVPWSLCPLSFSPTHPPTSPYHAGDRRRGSGRGGFLLRAVQAPTRALQPPVHHLLHPKRQDRDREARGTR